MLHALQTVFLFKQSSIISLSEECLVCSNTAVLLLLGHRNLRLLTSCVVTVMTQVCHATMVGSQVQGCQYNATGCLQAWGDNTRKGDGVSVFLQWCSSRSWQGVMWYIYIYIYIYISVCVCVYNLQECWTVPQDTKTTVKIKMFIMVLTGFHRFTPVHILTACFSNEGLNFIYS